MKLRSKCFREVLIIVHLLFILFDDGAHLSEVVLECRIVLNSNLVIGALLPDDVSVFLQGLGEEWNELLGLCCELEKLVQITIIVLGLVGD